MLKTDVLSVHLVEECSKPSFRTFFVFEFFFSYQDRFSFFRFFFISSSQKVYFIIYLFQYYFWSSKSPVTTPRQPTVLRFKV